MYAQPLGTQPIDGVDLTDFILGKSETSGRESFPIFLGNDLYALKWRNMSRGKD